MHGKRIAVAFATSAALLGAGAALADTMHPELGAKLSGMGRHGIVNLQSSAAKGKPCWTFEVPTKGITASSIRDAAGMKVAELGMLPASYWVWVDTKGHPGELRGKRPLSLSSAAEAGVPRPGARLFSWHAALGMAITAERDQRRSTASMNQPGGVW